MTDPDLREYVEALLAEHQRATEMAERERENAARALSTEKRTAAQTAEREREKAAEALAEQLTRQIEQGDAALRDHIAQQVAQLGIMLDSTRREIDIRATAQQKAIEKSEQADDAKFQGVNAVRAQLGDLITAHQKTLGDLTSTLMPREVAESRIEDLRSRVEANREELGWSLPRAEFQRTLEEWTAWRARIDSTLVEIRTIAEARNTAHDRRDTRSSGWQIAVAGFVVTIVVTIVVVVANILMTSGVASH